LQLAVVQVPYPLPVQLCVPVPFVIVQARASLWQRPDSAWKVALHETSVQVAYPLPVQLWLPVPFAIEQARVSLRQAPLSTWKVDAQAVAVQVP
jgi:hypothetical protein